MGLRTLHPVSEPTARRWYDRYIGIGQLPAGKAWFMMRGDVQPVAWFDDWNQVVIGSEPVILAGKRMVFGKN